MVISRNKRILSVEGGGSDNDVNRRSMHEF